MCMFTTLTWFSIIRVSSVHDVEQCGQHLWGNGQTVAFNVCCCILFTHIHTFTTLTWFSIIRVGSVHNAKHCSQYSWCNRQTIICNVRCCTLFTHMRTFTALMQSILTMQRTDCRLYCAMLHTVHSHAPRIPLMWFSIICVGLYARCRTM